MSRAILSIVDKIRARWAWRTHALDSPDYDVQQNTVTNVVRWRECIPIWDEPNPWRYGYPPTWPTISNLQRAMRAVDVGEPA
jgi:hypothetical protein